MSIRVMLADDHPVILLGVEAIIDKRGRPEIEIVGKARDVTQLFVKLREMPCDLLITDFNMPGAELGDGLQMLGRLSREFPKLRILVISMLYNPAMVRAILSAGAHGVFDKRDDLNHLIDAVRALMRGQRYMSETHRLSLDAGEGGIEPLPLSKKELEVVRLIVQGLSGRQIAEILHRSEKTISRQKRDAMRKLDIVHDSMLREAIESRGLV